MMITHPHSSLASVQLLLKRFSTLSYYKVNEHKSYILDLGIDATTSNLLQTQYPYPWADDGIPYLGITLTKSTRGLFAHNYTGAKQMMITETTRLSKHEFSWAGRLAAFKMMVLPRLLYIFRTLPIPLSSSYLKSLQSVLSQFVWQGKKSRCSHTKLIKHRSTGGMGYIDIKDYYYATILSQIKEWMNTSPTTLWSDIENHMMPGTNLANWLFSTSTHNTHLFHYSPTVQASVKVWHALHITKLARLTTKPLHIPLNTLKLLTPHLSIPSWITDRVKHTQELRNLTTCKSFSQISKDLKAPSKDFLTYLLPTTKMFNGTRIYRRSTAPKTLKLLFYRTL